MNMKMICLGREITYILLKKKAHATSYPVTFWRSAAACATRASSAWPCRLGYDSQSGAHARSREGRQGRGSRVAETTARSAGCTVSVCNGDATARRVDASSDEV